MRSRLPSVAGCSLSDQVKNVKQISCHVLALLSIFIFGVPAGALDPNQPASSFLRTHFTTEEGLPAAVIDHIEQTPDGFLWLITNNQYLNRFDGKNFHYFDKPRIRRIAVGPDGDLWAATPEGLVRIPSSDFNQFTLDGLVSYSPGPGKANNIRSLRFTSNGVLWVGTAGGLFRFEREREQFVAVGPRVPTHQIEEAPDGHLLVINDQGFLELAGSEILPHPQLAAQLGVNDNEIFDVLKDRHGNTWYCTAMGVARETNGRIAKLDTYARMGHKAFRAHEDPHGTVWFGKEEGLFRATAEGLEKVAGGMQVRSFFSDREGNLWIGTNGDGLYRFKDSAVRVYTEKDGLPKDVVMTVIAHDGAVWTGTNCGGLTRFDGIHFQTYKESDGLANTCIWALAVDSNRDLWLGTWGGGAFRYHNGKFTQYAKNQGMADDIVTSIIAGRDGSVWFGTHGGITRLKNGELKTFTTADGLAQSWVPGMFEDRSGTLWVGSQQGLYKFANDRFERVASVPEILVSPLGEDRSGGLFIGLDIEPGPLAWRLDKARVDVIKEVSAYDMIETEQGELWFGGNNISRVLPGGFTHVRAHDDPLDYEAFSPADGLSTAQTSGSDRSLALTDDDKLWVATPQGLAMFDLRRLAITNTKPAIYLTDLTIGRNTQRAGRDVVLPPGTNHVEIHFAAVETSAPEKIRMQYRLDGVDSEWLDAPRNPVAIYSNIPVGTHALHIRACNRNGVWDRQGAVFYITQQAYFYQTRWFAVAMFVLGILLIVPIYRLRVAQISRRMSARFDERLAERTRVARELHDTLLQTVQGSKMVADHALKHSADHTRMVRAMEQLATWLAQATEEGRAALQSLRSSTTEKNDLAQAFRRAIDECGIGDKAQVAFSVKGNSIEMHPVVRDEIYRIGYEAIRNACAHSGADRLEITLEYAHDLTLRIADNGGGIDNEVLKEGKVGHFGLRGMRERAERIGAELSLVSSPGSGTSITLVVPGRVAFRGSRRRLDQQKSR
jgi:signal transduction histidine kinase/ligand-binding sensor domain-containing protein